MKAKLSIIFFLMLCLVSSIQIANASPIPVFDGDYKALMQKAVKEGKASAWLSGPVADYMREQIKRPNAKILLEATRLNGHGKSGCKGIQMKFTTPGTQLPLTDGTSKELDVGYLMNWCPE
jgi:hypothetical protein